MKILLVEDCKNIAYCVKQVLDIDADIVHALNGAEAISILNKETFDVIVCDHCMPVSTGEKVYTHLRNVLKRKTFFIHHSSMPETVLKVYKGYDKDKNFHIAEKVIGLADLGDLVKNRTQEA